MNQTGQNMSRNVQVTKNTILSFLQQKYGSIILLNEFPKAFPEHPTNIRAVLLGCDPANKHCSHLPYVFAIQSGIKIFNSFVASIEANLSEIGLSLEQVYCQNLCRNYFEFETSKNPIWKEAAQFWIPLLKDELEQFPPDTPILLTAEILYAVLLKPGLKPRKAKEFYRCSPDAKLPIPASDNKLSRPLLPFYRHRSYQLTTGVWKEYQERIKELV